MFDMRRCGVDRLLLQGVNYEHLISSKSHGLLLIMFIISQFLLKTDTDSKFMFVQKVFV